MEIFCPKCGKEIEQKDSLHGFCESCYLKDHANAINWPEKIEIQKCNSCLKIKFQGNFVESNSEILKKIISSKIKSKNKFEIKQISLLNEKNSENINFVLIKAVVFIDKKQIELEKKIPFKLLGGICDPCMRIKSNYFEATLQFRFENPTNPKMAFYYDKVEKETAKLFRTNPLSKIVNDEWYNNGFDIILASNKAARKIVTLFKPALSEKLITSMKIAGVWPTGIQKKRYAYSMRFD